MTQNQDFRNVFKIGDGCSYGIGTDRYPATIVGITAKSVTVQDDKFTPDEGHDFYGTQKWKFEPNPKAPMKTFRLNKFGSLRNKGSYYLDLLNCRRAYQDPGF